MGEQKHHFERLTPIDNVDLGIYEEAIDYVFAHDDIKNVAISGSYSSGKSSLLASYKKKHTDKSFLHISLAHFKEDGADGTTVKESVLEGKILNQLIHQIPAEKIPQTEFRVKEEVNKSQIGWITTGIVILIGEFIHFAYFGGWEIIAEKLYDVSIDTSIESIASLAFLAVNIVFTIALFWYYLYRIILIQKSKNVFRKLNVQGNEIEIFKDSDESFFDKYLNEVLYLFVNVDASVIVFEDIDRFEANQIFERLREVNVLANIQRERRGKETLRFFYLLRDDIFPSKDRTKFFDYIIPVVPVVDGSNSYDQLIAHFKKSGIYDKMDGGFLQGLSLYIDDMRLLKNIYNEFAIYYDRLNNIELDCNKMLAIIVYKNLFPSDFSSLQLGKGFVHTLFASREEFIKGEKSKITKDICDIKEKIKSIEEEHLVSVQEIALAFARKYMRYYDLRHNDDKDLPDLVLNKLNGPNREEYLSRTKILEDKQNGKVNDLQQQIISLEKSEIELKGESLQQIIAHKDIDEIFLVTVKNPIGDETTFTEVKGNDYFDLLKYLIRNGYIDETYADYMTYFYENSLSREDKIFLRSVTDKKAKEYNYKLRNPGLVVSRLRPVDFEQQEILNFDLLNYLLQCQKSNEHSEYQEHLGIFFEQIKNTTNLRFVREYIDANLNSTFLENLNERWPEVFSEMLKEKILSNKLIREYSKLSIYCSADKTLELMNSNGCLRDYISNSRDYLAIEDPYIEKLIHGFQLLGVSFVGFTYESVDKDLFNAVYENSLYQINAENIRLIQREILGVQDEEKIKHKNYTILMDHPDSAIAKYMNQHINDYFAVVLEMCAGTIDDDESAAIHVLNMTEISAGNKEKYISARVTGISSVKGVTNHSLWGKLLDKELVEYSENNIMECFIAMGLSERVINYINNGNADLDFSRTEHKEEARKKLFDSVIRCNDLDNKKYEQILCSLNIDLEDFDITDITPEKFSILVDRQIIKMTEGNLNFVRDNYANLVGEYIRGNIEKYTELVEQGFVKPKELPEILKWEISDELKIRLLKCSDQEFAIYQKGYTLAVNLYIIQHNFDTTDVPNLYSSYETWSKPIKEKIFDYAVGNIENILDDVTSVSKVLKNELFYSDRLEKETKIDLLIAMMPELNPDDLQSMFQALGLEEYCKIFKNRSRPKFKIDEMNQKLLSALEKNKFIESYTMDEARKYFKIKKIESTK